MRSSKKIFIKFTALLLLTFLSCSERPDPKLPEFKNIVNKSGIRGMSTFGQTASWVDFDNDGFIDLLVGNADIGKENLFFFKNNRNLKFSNITDEVNLENIPLRSSTWADFNNDGFVDLLIGTIKSREATILYKNQGGKSFTKVTQESGLLINPSSNNHNIWADFNNDGFVDVIELSSGAPLFFKNNGDGSFSNNSKNAGLGKSVSAKSAVSFDFNNDGFQDLFVASKGSNKFYQNNGNGVFKDITKNSNLEGHSTWHTVAACTGDINNDGYLDIYIGNISSFRNSLFRNNGDGTFTDITKASETEDVGDARTCAMIDFNSDGLIDIFTTNHIDINKLYLNKGKEEFTNVSEQTGIKLPLDVFAATWGDVDNDGFLDVFLNGHIGTGLMKNSGNNNKNIVVKLVGNGTSTNTSAIGSRVILKTSRGMQMREVSGGSGCCEQNMLPLHFGVGKEKDANLIVKWTDGKQCKFDNLVLDTSKRLKIYQNECVFENF